MDAFIKLRKISKMFGGNYVLRDVDLDIYRGDVHAIIGENGAGSSAAFTNPTRAKYGRTARRSNCTTPLTPTSTVSALFTRN